MKLRNRYFLLRHGETIYQTEKKGFVYPWPENPVIELTKRGERQIRTVARKLKKEKPSTKTKFGAGLVSHRPAPRIGGGAGAGIDLIFASDFFRTRQTAEIVAKELGKKVIFDKRLRDVNLGIYRGRSRKEFYRDFPRISPERFIKRPPQGESWQDCQKRILGFFKEIDKKYKGETILIVGHGDPLWLLEGAMKKWSPKNFIKTSASNYIQPAELRKLN